MGIFNTIVGGAIKGVQSIFDNRSKKHAAQRDRDFESQENEKTRQFNHDEAQLDRDFQERMFNQSNDWNLNMWNKQNEYNEEMYNKYNSPSAQVRQLAQAGLNPNLANAGVSSISPAQAIGVNSAPSGVSASSSGSGSSHEEPGTSPLNYIYDGILDAIRFSEETKKTKADTRKTNAEAEDLEIRNRREKSKDDFIKDNLVYDPHEGRFLNVNDMSVSPEAKNSYVFLGNLNSGHLEAQQTIHGYLKDARHNELEKLQNAFARQVENAKLNGTVVVNGKKLSYAQAIASIDPYHFKELLTSIDKLSQDIDNAKTEKEYKEELTRKIKAENEGNTPFAASIKAMMEKGFTWDGLVDILVNGFAAFFSPVSSTAALGLGK